MMEIKVAPPESMACEEALYEEATFKEATPGLTKYEETALEAPLLKEAVDFSIEKESSPAQNQPFCAEVGRIACAGCPFLKICKSEELDSFVSFAEEYGDAEKRAEKSIEENTIEGLESIGDILPKLEAEVKNIFELHPEKRIEQEVKVESEARAAIKVITVPDIGVAHEEMVKTDAKTGIRPEIKAKPEVKIQAETKSKPEVKIQAETKSKTEAKIVIDEHSGVVEPKLSLEIKYVANQKAEKKSQVKIKKQEPERIKNTQTNIILAEKPKKEFSAKNVRPAYKAMQRVARTAKPIYEFIQEETKTVKTKKGVENLIVTDQQKQKKEITTKQPELNIAEITKPKKPSFRELLFDDSVDIITTKGFTTTLKFEKEEETTHQAIPNAEQEIVETTNYAVDISEEAEPIIGDHNIVSEESFSSDETIIYKDKAQKRNDEQLNAIKESILMGHDDSTEQVLVEAEENYKYLDIKPLALSENMSTKSSVDIIIRCILGAISIGLYNNIYAQRFSLASDSSRK